MKRMTVVLGVALAGALMSAGAQVSFEHLKSVDLSSYFPAGGQLGDLASDVAFDGANLYIAGMSTANSLAEPVGVLKISNALSLNVNAWGYTPLITLTQAGQSRSSYVVYHDGFLYLGTGLGDGGNVADRTGIRKYDAQTGTQVSGWNGTGVVLPSDLDGSGRAECIEIDPGYQGSGQSLAVLARARGFIFRRDFATGNALSDILSQPFRDCTSNPPTGSTTGMRDITFSPEGDAYLRVDNSIFYAQRTGPDSVALERACQIFDFSSDNAFQVLINIHYLRTSAGDYLLYNRRGTTPTSLNKIFVAKRSGATWQDYAELTGDEPLPNGSTPNPFGGNIFNFTSGFGPDPSKGDVNLDGIVDDADLLAILFAFGSSDAAVDVNSDGIVDDADLLTVLFNFGSSPQAQYLFVVHSTIGTDRLDIYRVDVN
ncbi:hypothetical protein [Synechococcus sp. RC10A2]|uniref:hypothetical protein n=1 Tax=Synechococcus sp. RC10A2 TaxID=2964529 RepID=UPI0039C74674